MRILLTGGNGFIGKNIFEELSPNFEIIAPRSSELDLTDDKAVYSFLEKNPVDVVLHCANLAIYEELVPDSTEKNLRMFFNLIRAKKFYKKMIAMGSGAEYDKTKPISNIIEDDCGRSVPKDSYGFYKYVCSNIAENSDFIIHLRLFGVYGKYEDYNRRFISYAICRSLLGRPIKMNQNVFFDYLYVKDLARIIELFIEKKDALKHNIYNVGRGERIDLLSIANNVLKITKKKVPIIVAKSNLNNEYTCNIEKLKEEISDFKFTDFEASLHELIEYYKKNLPNLNKEILLTE